MEQHLVTVVIDKAQVDRVQAILAHVTNGTQTVFPRAINRTMSSARVRIAREISTSLHLGMRKIQARIYLRKAYRTKWQGFMGLGNYPFDLAADFGAKDTGTRGVQVTVLRGHRLIFPRAFIPAADRAKRKEGFEFLQATGLRSSHATFRFWRGYNKVLMRGYRGAAGSVLRGKRGQYRFGHATGDRVTWRSPDTGAALVGRLPVAVVVGPSLADLWEEAPAMVANALEYSQHTLKKNIDDQVKLLLRQKLGKT